MFTDIDTELRAFADRLDRAMPAISAEEVRSAVADRPNSQPPGATTRRLALVAAALLLIVGGTVAVVATRNMNGDGTRLPSGTLVPPDIDPDLHDSPPVDARVAGTTDLPATSLPVDPTPSVAPLAPAPTVDEVRRAQLDALRNLPGFVATVETTQSIDGRTTVEETSLSMLADGSYYTESGPGLFASYDPSTDTELAAYRDEAGGISYRQTEGMGPNFHPMRNYDPTEVVQELPQGAAEQVVEAVEHDGEPAWQVTTTVEVAMPDDSLATMVTRDVIDPTTGLLLARSRTSTDEQIPSLDARMIDVRAIEAMPEAFPGSFPRGAEVSETEDTSDSGRVDADGVAAMFGIPTPIPAMADTALTTAFDSYDSRQATFTIMDGFVRTASVTVRAQTLPEGSALTPKMMLRDDGYVCPDLDVDQQCDTYAVFAPDPDAPSGGLPVFFRISAGALSGQTAAFQGLNTVVILPPFQIDIDADSEQLEREIAETFELVTPS